MVSNGVQVVRNEIMSDKLKKIADEIRQAVENPGLRPEYHAVLLRKHRMQWPSLWSGIDKLLKELENATDPAQGGARSLTD